MSKCTSQAQARGLAQCPLSGIIYGGWAALNGLHPALYGGWQGQDHCRNVESTVGIPQDVTRDKEAGMRKATRIVAALFGAFAGFGGPEHGYFEILRGNARPDSLIIAAMGPPCEPEKVWNLCEPAMTVIPSYLATGILAFVIGLITMIWAVAFVHRKHGGLVLILLSIVLLLVGGGLFPPVIGIVAGLVATRINAPLTRQPSHLYGKVLRFLAKLWPWPLVAFFVWAFGQFIVGYFFNEFLQQSGFLAPLLIVGLLGLSILTGYARDVHDHDCVVVWKVPSP